MDKAWVWLPRNCVECQQEASKFVFDSARRLGNVSYMFCPCLDCRNVVHQSKETVFDHLVIRGMDDKYKRNSCWSKHGDINNVSEESDGDVGIVDIYDYWRQDDEVIAQGILMSTKPEELVHGMPLGLKAGTVKITQVFKAGAYIWRPTPTIPYMADALNETIAWPLDRLKLQDQSEESGRKSPMESTRKSVEKSGSPSTGNSGKGGKPKCALMDIGNSGQRVAIGRLFSNDPAATVHCISIGPNASKVLIEIPKVNARVWRESPEVQTIDDASRTFVAWPNEKIIML